MRKPPAPLTAPWAITQSGAQLVLAVWSRGEFFREVRERALSAHEGKPLENARNVEVRDGVAVIPISGPLFRHAGLFAAISGGTSYATVRRDLQRALDDPGVRAVLLDVNSPGGEVDGCAELAAAIREADEVKPVEVYAGGLAASAGYWLASAARRITCSETAMLGSIGVLNVLFDSSEADEKAGRKQVEIVSSVSPSKRSSPVDDEVIARTQRHVDDLADIFVGTVARNRGASTKKVLADFGQGDVMIASRAIAAGMADEIGSFESTLARLARGESEPRASRPAAEEENMPNDDEKPEGATDDNEPEQAAADDDTKECSKCKGTGKVAKAEGDEMPEEKEEEKDAKAEMARALGLSPSASLRQIATAFAAKTVSTAEARALRSENQLLAGRLEVIERREATAKAQAFVDQAIADHRASPKARARLVDEYVAADLKQAGTGQAAVEPFLAEKGELLAGLRFSDGKGGIIGKRDEQVNLAQADPGEIEAAFTKKAKEIAEAKKITFSAAVDLVRTESPDLYAAYAAIRR